MTNSMFGHFRASTKQTSTPRVVRAEANKLELVYKVTVASKSSDSWSATTWPTNSEPWPNSGKVVVSTGINRTRIKV